MAKKQTSLTFSEALLKYWGNVSAFNEAIEKGDAQKAYELFSEDPNYAIRNFDCLSVAQKVSFVPTYEQWDPRIKSTSDFSPELFYNKRALGKAVDLVKDQLGRRKAKKLEKTVIKHFTKEAKKTSKARRNAIKSYIQQARDWVIISRKRFIG